MQTSGHREGCLQIREKVRISSKLLGPQRLHRSLVGRGRREEGLRQLGCHIRSPECDRLGLGPRLPGSGLWALSCRQGLERGATSWQRHVRKLNLVSRGTTWRPWGWLGGTRLHQGCRDGMVAINMVMLAPPPRLHHCLHSSPAPLLHSLAFEGLVSLPPPLDLELGQVTCSNPGMSAKARTCLCGWALSAGFCHCHESTVLPWAQKNERCSAQPGSEASSLPPDQPNPSLIADA